MKVLSVGGSRNIGYYSSVRLLQSGATVTFLLRNPSVFDNDEVIQPFVKSGKAVLVKGDALVQDDCKKAWDAAAKAEPAGEEVEYLIFTVGGTPKFVLTKGFVITPHNLVTQSLLNFLTTLPSLSTKVITISSTGLTHTSHKHLPLPLKPLYAYLLTVPHNDKVGAERVVAHCAGWPWNVKDDGEPGEDIMGPGDWRKREGLVEEGKLKEILVIRPALLTDGECNAEKMEGKGKEGYRVKEGELNGGWTVSRKDVAHFLVEGAVKHWDQWGGKCVSIAY